MAEAEGTDALRLILRLFAEGRLAYRERSEKKPWNVVSRARRLVRGAWFVDALVESRPRRNAGKGTP